MRSVCLSRGAYCKDAGPPYQFRGKFYWFRDNHYLLGDLDKYK